MVFKLSFKALHLQDCAKQQRSSGIAVAGSNAAAVVGSLGSSCLSHSQLPASCHGMNVVILTAIPEQYVSCRCIKSMCYSGRGMSLSLSLRNTLKG